MEEQNANYLLQHTYLSYVSSDLVSLVVTWQQPGKYKLQGWVDFRSSARCTWPCLISVLHWLGM